MGRRQGREQARDAQLLGGLNLRSGGLAGRVDALLGAGGLLAQLTVRLEVGCRDRRICACRERGESGDDEEGTHYASFLRLLCQIQKLMISGAWSWGDHRFDVNDIVHALNDITKPSSRAPRLALFRANFQID